MTPAPPNLIPAVMTRMRVSAPPPTLRLNRRRDGRWQKKIDGELFYFGNAETTEEQARLRLIEFLQRRMLRHNAPPPSDRLEVRLVADRFAAACLLRVADGNMLDASWKSYDKAVGEFVKAVGRNTLVAALGADAFASVRRNWAVRYGCYALDRNVQAIRTMFNWAYENRVISALPFFGDGFAKTSNGDKAGERLMRRQTDGDRPFTPEEVRVLLDHPKCRGPLRTFILLGLNGGLYSVDISDLLWRDIVCEDGVWLIHNRRRKTGAPRRCPLWPEVVDAIGPHRRHAADAPVFLTRQGNPWNRRNGTDSISLLFQRLKAAAGVTGSGFGAMRHTHVSTIGDHPDRDAAHLVRGHQIPGIDRHYDFPSVGRLKAVTDLARERLLQH